MNRKNRLFALLGVFAVGALISLPWQLKQWQTLKTEREKTSQQEAKLRELAQNKSALDQARSARPSDPASRMEAATTLVRTGDFKSARPLLAQLEEDAQRVPGMHSILGDLYRQTGQVDRAYRLLSSALSVSPDDPTTLVRMGYLELSLGSREDGLAHFRQAQQSAPEAPEPLLAEAFYQDQERAYPTGERLLRKALALQPDRWTTEVLLAENLEKQKRYDEALTLLQTLKTKYPAEAPILAQQAHTLLAAADAQPEKAGPYRKQAIEALEAAFALAPGDASLPFELGRARKILGDQKAAQKAWEESYRLKPNYPKLRGQLGQLLLHNGQPERGRQLLQEEAAAEKARTDFNVEVGKAVQRWKDPQARRALAQWCTIHQQLSRAILEWERFLKDYPGDQEATAALERLKNIE